MLCINHYRNNVFLQPSVSKNLENTFKLGDISGIQTDRILAKHEVKKNTKHCKLREQKFANGKNMRTKNEEDKTQTYKNTKKEVLSELDTYMRSYVSRYEKRKGLENLDCFCEKKVFDIIDKIDKARKSNNKKLKKKLHLKYRFCFVTTCLIPFLGLIFPILDNIKFNTTTSGSTGSCKSILCAAGISVPNHLLKFYYIHYYNFIYIFSLCVYAEQCIHLCLLERTI
ncbi:variable surface protein [Plasmodium gonderi]|uniref:Variable surface protein n=1 Tax=Plasmodium gonderi TaxID=77519 RepID=A0A1Y1JHL7_PLAGO|nr:variable surface protein [Plasmodium gonderi]GAW82029.1 variable surface protein [Plasmodium gonderi]